MARGCRSLPDGGADPAGERASLFNLVGGSKSGMHHKIALPLTHSHDASQRSRHGPDGASGARVPPPLWVLPCPRHKRAGEARLNPSYRR